MACVYNQKKNVKKSKAQRKYTKTRAEQTLTYKS